MAIILIITLFALAMALYDYYDSREWTYVTSPTRNNKVFEERNKKYGAYSIRRDYNVLLIIILFCVFGFVLLFKVFTMAFIDRSTYVTIAPKYDTTEITLQAPPLQEIKTVKTPYKIESGGGSGTPDKAPKDLNPKPMVSKPGAITASDDTKKPKVGQGNKTTGDNVKNPATTKNPNPFANGSDGSGGGNTGGNGKGFGDDDGPGDGPGKGPGKGGAAKRTRIAQPSSNDIESDENCRIVFTIIVNADGNVISATEVRAETTTSNTALIAKVRALVKRDTKYNAKPGASNFSEKITINVKAR